jgi:hypothetical protein
MVKLLLISTSLILFCTSAFGDIGKITEEKGTGALIVREQNQLDARVNTGINSMDTVRTGKGTIGITFEDKTQVKITENSKLVIDNFVYDAANNDGKLNMKVALGTVRYASGAIAHNNAENVSIKTPTASISVRGTAFTMTVDEIGRSLIILLPNEDGSVGSILVGTDAGFVILTQAFQATLTQTSDQKPLQPTLLNLTENMIDNMLIVKPPVEVAQEKEEATRNTFLDKNQLDENLFDVAFLDEEQITFDQLNITDLDVDLFGDALEAGIMNKLIAGRNAATQVYMFEAAGGFQITRKVVHNFTMVVKQDQDYKIDITQDGTTVNIVTNENAVNKIRITQQAQ